MEENKNIKELLKLTNENPELEVIPMVDTDLIYDDWAWVRGWVGEVKLDEYWTDDDNEGRIYLRSRDEDEAVEDIMHRIERVNPKEDWSDDVLEVMAREKIVWEKAIFVWIGT